MQTLVIPDLAPELKEIRDELAAMRQLLEKVVMTPRPEWVTVHEYAAHIGKSSRTVTRMISAGEVESKKIGTAWMVKL